MTQRRSILKQGVLVLLLGAQHIARGAGIVAVRVWPSKDYTRLTIESDGEIKTRQFFIAEPPRLAVDIEGIDLLPVLRELVAKVRPDDPNILGIRVGQNTPGVVRLVIDLKQPIFPQVFTLPPVAAYQYRLVLDLYPTQVADPLEALIAERLADKKQTLSTQTPPISVPDPLGELMAKQSGKPAIAAPPTPQPPTPPLTKPAEAAFPPSGKTDRLIIVALDPGHGGEDPGAIGPGGTLEKDVVLQIAQRLRDRINQQPNMRAYMTRDTDFFVPLHIRVQKARKVQADLFISIHADAFFTERPQGATRYLGPTERFGSVTAPWRNGIN